MTEQEDDKTIIVRQQKEIASLKNTIVCAKIDADNYEVNRILQNKIIDDKNLELKSIKSSMVATIPV